MNNRGSVYKNGDILVQDPEFVPFWWDIHTSRVVNTYENHFKECSSNAKHIKLLDKEPSWKLIEDVSKFFPQLVTLIIETFPRGRASDGFQLKVTTLVVVTDFTFDQPMSVYQQLKNIYINKWRKQQTEVNFYNIGNFSVLRVGTIALNRLSFHRPICTLELYNVHVEEKLKRLSIIADNYRIHANLYRFIDCQGARLLQLYNQMTKPLTNEDVGVINEMKRLRDFIIAENTFDNNQITRLRLHKDCLVAIPSSELYKYLGKFPKYNIYGVPSSRQMCVYDGKTLVCNFKIIKEAPWSTTLSTIGSNLVIQNEIVISPTGSVVAIKTSKYKITPKKVELSITSKTSKEIILMLKDLKWETIEALSITFLDVEKSQVELESLKNELQINLKKMDIRFFNYNQKEIGK